ncbi:MAG: 3-phosphoshikimate 1-carboxyvinyltransferase, partial [Gemmatimonadales bacterium]
MEVTGRIRVPGDKSITQRLLMFGALANGESVIQRPLRSHDTRSMIDALSSLGVAIEAGPNSITIVGRGRRALVAPVHMVECGNSGTAARFLIGAIAAHPMDATIAGDESLNRRPMRRVTRPLAAMGGRFTEHNGDGLPLTVRGGELDPLEDYALPQASAQVKTALLLAGYAAGVPVSLVEPFRSRDHTERILRELGLDVAVEGNTTAFTPSHPIEGFETRVPGDPSSAAFVVGHLLLTDSRTTTIESLGINPTRMGFFRVLQRMGADIHWSETGAVLGEPVGELTVTGSRQLSAARVAPG